MAVAMEQTDRLTLDAFVRALLDECPAWDDAVELGISRLEENRPVYLALRREILAKALRSEIRHAVHKNNAKLWNDVRPVRPLTHRVTGTLERAPAAATEPAEKAMIEPVPGQSARRTAGILLSMQLTVYEHELGGGVKLGDATMAQVFYAEQLHQKYHLASALKVRWYQLIRAGHKTNEVVRDVHSEEALLAFREKAKAMIFGKVSANA